MQGLVSVWRILTPTKRIALIASVAATVGLLALMAQSASKPPMSLLYANLDSRDAGRVVSALEKMDVSYEIRGEAIYVPVSRRDAARMSLASQGLPAQGQAGYELLDKLNGFSTTADMFDATYWRAKEGELARTILSTPGVRAARVHIAHQRTGPFSRAPAPPTAVVTVTTGQIRLVESQAHAMRFLVASAVPGLAADQVAVIDSERGVILSPGKSNDFFAGEEGLANREQQLRKDLLDLLEARVGPGNARVQVSLELDMEREAVSERIINPDARIISGKETTEITERSTGSRGAVTVASNLPEGDATNDPSQRSERTETKETLSYDVSEIRRDREKAPGAVKRMSIAVFVNQTIDPRGDAAEPGARTEEELETLRLLVASAAGINEARGDSIIVQALPFQPAPEGGVLVTANQVENLIERHLMSAIQVAVLAIVTIVLGLFVVKPLLMTKDTPSTDQLALASPDGHSAPGAGEAAGAPPEDPIANLKQIASSKSDETAKLLRNWLEKAEDAA